LLSLNYQIKVSATRSVSYQMEDCYKHSYRNIVLNYDQYIEFKFNKKQLCFFISRFFHGTLIHISRNNSAPWNKVWETLDTRYVLERTDCRANCRYKHPGKQFQTRLYQRVISRAGNNRRGCRVEDQWKGNNSNDSDEKRKTRD
jgi:hypothetical protein